MKIFLIILFLFAIIFLIAIFIAIAYSAGLVLNRIEYLNFCIQNFFCYKKTEEYLDTEWRQKTDQLYHSHNLNAIYEAPLISAEKKWEINSCILSMFYETAIFQRLVSNSSLDKTEIIFFMKNLGDFLHEIPSEWNSFLFLYKGKWNKENELKFCSFINWIIRLKCFCKSIPNSCAGNFNYDTGYCFERIENNCDKILDIAEYKQESEQP